MKKKRETGISRKEAEATVRSSVKLAQWLRKHAVDIGQIADTLDISTTWVRKMLDADKVVAVAQNPHATQEELQNALRLADKWWGKDWVETFSEALETFSEATSKRIEQEASHGES
jgi:hypothetical protein